MSNFEKIYRILSETPFVGPEDKMESKKLSEISEVALRKFWRKIASVNDFEIYQSKNNLNFISGKLNYHKFKFYVDLVCTLPYKNAPIFLKNSIQVEMVNTSDEFQTKGYAKQVYKEIIKKYVLISDTEQYQASKALWKSIAREPDIFVYIWNDSIGDFIRNEDGLLKRYNGSNIIEQDIFGMETKHWKIVLVASNKELKDKKK